MGMFDKKITWDGFDREDYKDLDKDVAVFLQGLLEKNPLKRIKPLQALNCSLFTNEKVISSWNMFCQKKIDTRYDKILKMANVN